MRGFFLKNRKLLKKCHLWQMLRTHAKKRHLSFHTPGHKIGKYDLTELSFSDNLSSPRGVIARAEADIATILGAAKSFILTDGSTSGVFSMLYAAKRAGAKTVAFVENAHKSVYNACKILGLTPLVLPQQTDKPFDVNELQKTHGELFRAADALLLTSPDYYGFIPDLRAVRTLCDREKKLLLIDGAHGGHLHFDKTLYAGAFADLWVDGVHKSLPALTQGAIASAKTQTLADLLFEGVNVFRTTSPSYPIMASVEFAVKYPRNEDLENAVRAWANKEERILLNADWTKVCARFGENAFAAEKHFESQGIYAEFCDGEIVMFYLSPATTKGQFSALQKAINTAFKRFPYNPKKEIQPIPAHLVLKKSNEKEWVEISKAEGRICAENVGLFPPCTPLISDGQTIGKEKLALLEKADNVFGVNENKILVYKDE